MRTREKPRQDWTVVLRRRPARIVAGQPEGGYTDMFEIICSDCGDHPDLDYREVSPELQRIRGPHPIAAGVAAYVKHVKRHPADRRFTSQGARSAMSTRGDPPLPPRSGPGPSRIRGGDLGT